MKGARLNVRGRPRGLPNSSTIEANALLKSEAARAAAILAAKMNSKNEWISINAASQILQRCNLDGTQIDDTCDPRVVHHMTEREINIVVRIFERAQRRFESRNEIHDIEVQARNEALVAWEAPAVAHEDAPVDLDALQPDEEEFG